MTHGLDKSMEGYLNIIRKVNMLILMPELLNCRFSACSSKFRKVKFVTENQICDFLPLYNLKPSLVQYIYPISYKIAKKANPRKWNCPIENRRYAIRAKISDISQDFRVDDIFIRKDAIQVLKAVFGGG